MTDAEMKGMEWGNVNSNESKLREMNGMIRNDKKGMEMKGNKGKRM